VETDITPLLHEGKKEEAVARGLRAMREQGLESRNFRFLP
jgi:hypothetical protein